MTSIRVCRNIHTAFGRPRFRARSAICPTTINFCRQIPPYTVRPSPEKEVSVSNYHPSSPLPDILSDLLAWASLCPPPKKSKKGILSQICGWVCKSHRLSKSWKKCFSLTHLFGLVFILHTYFWKKVFPFHTPFECTFGKPNEGDRPNNSKKNNSTFRALTCRRLRRRETLLNGHRRPLLYIGGGGLLTAPRQSGGILPRGVRYCEGGGGRLKRRKKWSFRTRKKDSSFPAKKRRKTGTKSRGIDIY